MFFLELNFVFLYFHGWNLTGRFTQFVRWPVGGASGHHENTLFLVSNMFFFQLFFFFFVSYQNISSNIDLSLKTF